MKVESIEKQLEEIGKDLKDGDLLLCLKHANHEYVKIQINKDLKQVLDSDTYRKVVSIFMRSTKPWLVLSGEI